MDERDDVRQSENQESGSREVSVRPWGPGQEELDAAAHALMSNRSVSKILRGVRYRLVSIEPYDSEVKDNESPPDRYRATIYDYTNNRTLVIYGGLGRSLRITVEVTSVQPPPTREEFEEALEVLAADAEFSEAIRGGRLLPYRPMPPLAGRELQDGRIDRTVTVGLMPESDGEGHEIVGVSLASRSIVRYEGGAPGGSMAVAQVCGPVSANQATAAKGTAGSFEVTITRAGAEIWKFLAIRPAASSGTNGSAIELRRVDYRGQRVLARAHVPILNVRYDGNACGPYRDWQWQESKIEANGADVAPGFRRCPTPARTILESGTDRGNFLGVALYEVGNEVVLVSEMEAGWYRYVSQWRFHDDGTIRPRFGFSAVRSSCVCVKHHHHVYWRFDFDIRTLDNRADNVVREFNDPPLDGAANWHSLDFEVKRARDASRKRKWSVENPATAKGYSLVPGASDGAADSFGVGDMWALRYREDPSTHRTLEIDDGQRASYSGPIPASQAMSHLDRFVNGASINNKDVVLWYAAHFTHNINEEAGHIVGPDLLPSSNW
jgi:hypothetical protein